MPVGKAAVSVHAEAVSLNPACGVVHTHDHCIGAVVDLVCGRDAGDGDALGGDVGRGRGLVGDEVVADVCTGVRAGQCHHLVGTHMLVAENTRGVYDEIVPDDPARCTCSRCGICISVYRGVYCGGVVAVVFLATGGDAANGNGALRDLAAGGLQGDGVVCAVVAVVDDIARGTRDHIQSAGARTHRLAVKGLRQVGDAVADLQAAHQHGAQRGGGGVVDLGLAHGRQGQSRWVDGQRTVYIVEGIVTRRGIAASAQGVRTSIANALCRTAPGHCPCEHAGVFAAGKAAVAQAVAAGPVLAIVGFDGVIGRDGQGALGNRATSTIEDSADREAVIACIRSADANHFERIALVDARVFIGKRANHTDAYIVNNIVYCQLVGGEVDIGHTRATVIDLAHTSGRHRQRELGDVGGGGGLIDDAVVIFSSAVQCVAERDRLAHASVLVCKGA